MLRRLPGSAACSWRIHFLYCSIFMSSPTCKKTTTKHLETAGPAKCGVQPSEHDLVEQDGFVPSCSTMGMRPLRGSRVISSPRAALTADLSPSIAILRRTPLSLPYGPSKRCATAGRCAFFHSLCSLSPAHISVLGRTSISLTEPRTACMALQSKPWATVWTPNLDADTYRLCIICQIGAHKTTPTRIKQGE